MPDRDIISCKIKKIHTGNYISSVFHTCMEFVTMLMSTMDQILAQVFDIANNTVLREWGIKTVESIADKSLQDMPEI